MIDHPARARVAEIAVSRAGKESTRGSGYVVAPGWVLTAHHVVRDAASVGVWLGAPAELVPEAGAGVDPGRVLTVPAADLALLPLGGPADDSRAEPALLGRLDREPGPAVPAAAAGCPRFKLRPAPGRPGVLLRELEYAIGSVAALSDAKTGRLAFAVDVPPGPDPDPGEHSPWEGMSGAAVWASGRLIGVIGQHHPRQGLATLTVRPVEQLFSYAPEAELEVWRAALPQLPATAADLWLATPPTVRKIEVARAQRAAEAVAPRVLIGRAAELAALEAFTSSGARWRWIQGEAFAGKTALLAWFALHPPGRVDVAACFLRRTTGDNAADYALDVLTRQLALLADRPGYLPPPFVSERSNDFADLLGEAARASAERGRRLLVLIDGLDEYDPTTASLDLAAWLPGDRTLPDPAMLIAASRPGADVRLPPGHPLSRFVQQITASEAATEIQQAAHTELDRALKATGGFASRAISFLAAAGSVLTSSDLRVLLKQRGTNVDIYEIEALLGSFLGRSLKRQSNTDGGDTPDLESEGTQGYVFAHDTLLTEARALIGDLRTYEGLLDGWAQEYAQQDWPVDTPQYLLAPYTRELARRARDPVTPNARGGKAMSRLTLLATNRRRHERMLERTLGDGAALAEIADAQELHLAQPRPDLTVLTLLAIERDRLIHRSQALPDGLPALWVQLGEPQRGQALARSLADPLRRAAAWARLAAALAVAGQRQQAEQAAHEAERAATALTDPWLRARTSARIAKALAGDLLEQAEQAAANAEHAANEIDEPTRRDAALARLASAFSAGGLLSEGERAANNIEDPAARAAAFSDLTRALAAAGQQEKAIQAAYGAKSAATDIIERAQKAKALAGVVDVLAAIGRPEEAEQMAADITEPIGRVLAFSHLTNALAEDGNLTQAEQAAHEAERAAARILYLSEETAALSHLTGVLAAVGQWAKAEQTAASIEEPTQRARAFARLASRAVGRHSELAVRATHQAERAATSIVDPGQQAAVLADLADALAAAGYLEQAVQAAARIPQLTQRARVLTRLAAALNAAGRHEQALRTARDAQLAASSVTNAQQQAAVLADLADALAAAGYLEQAVQAATDIGEHTLQDATLAHLANVLIAVGKLEQAEWAAAHISDAGQRARVLTRMVGVLTAAGHLD